LEAAEPRWQKKEASRDTSRGRENVKEKKAVPAFEKMAIGIEISIREKAAIPHCKRKEGKNN